MGHDNHTVMSPAHRRNQNPASPSAALFRRSSTFPREEPDLSWMALFRRHRFLLLMLALLAFLCTVYLYFAIKLGADNCSGLIGKDEALCRLKKSKAMEEHGHRTRRMLLDFQESVFEPWIKDHTQLPNDTDSTSWMNLLIEDRTDQNVLILGCSGKNLTQYSIPQISIFLPGIGCKESSFLGERPMEFLSSFFQMGALDASLSFDLIICEECDMIELMNDESKFSKLDRLLNNRGFFVWLFEMTAKTSSGFSLNNLQLPGFSCLSRVDGMVVWQKH